MKTTEKEMPVCYGNWWSVPYVGDCVARGCAMLNTCKRETLMRERQETEKCEKPVCYGHWWSRAFDGDCVAQGCEIQDICRRETLMRERLKEDASYLEPDRRFCRSGNCD